MLRHTQITPKLTPNPPQIQPKLMPNPTQPTVWVGLGMSLGWIWGGFGVSLGVSQHELQIFVQSRFWIDQFQTTEKKFDFIWAAVQKRFSLVEIISSEVGEEKIEKSAILNENEN